MKKIAKWIKKWMFLWALLLTGAGFLTYCGEWRVYGEPLQEMKNRILQVFSERERNALPLGNGQPEESRSLEESRLLQEAQSASAENEMAEDGIQEVLPDMSGMPEESTQEEETVWYSVEEDYFENVVFIGDSRTVGLFEYGGLEEKAAFYASTGLTIYKLFEAKVAETEGKKGKQTIEEALKERQFQSIYLMLGINEMGTGTVESFTEAYRDVVERLKELQPEAVIYIQSILKVTEERSGQGDYITNEGIEARNEALVQLADNTRVFYLDINPIVCDESGGMIPEWTTDGVHLKALYIPLWKEFLQNHVVRREND